VSAVLAIAGADFLERVRRFTFLVTVAASLYAGYLWLPDPHAGYATVIIDDHRGLYTSAFMGYGTAILTATFLSLIGFFLVRGAVERDRDLHTDGIVGASPVGRFAFLTGKFLSNLFVLCTVAAIAFAAAMLMQLLRGEERSFDLLAYLAPFAFVTVPAMALVAAIAIAFDVVPFLRGVLGGVAYFIAVWNPMLVIPLATSKNFSKPPPADPLGMYAVINSMHRATVAQFPRERGMDVDIGGAPAVNLGAPFIYHGMHWTFGLLAERAVWMLIAFALVAAVAPLFDRFCRDATGAKRERWSFDVARLIPNAGPLRVFRAEFALLVNGAGWWWLLGAAVLAVLTGVMPIGNVEKVVLPIALIWPLERLSALGSRERRWNVADILNATPGYAMSTLLVHWMAGSALGAGICAGFIVRLFASGYALGALACIAVVAAMSAAALAFGTLTGARRAFEAAYLVLWYLGPVNDVPQVNFAAAPLTAPAMLCAIAGAVAAAGVVTATLARAASSRR
jgi:hypothetical protein